MNSCPVGVGTVGDHGAHTVAPSGSLFYEEPAQSSFGASFDHVQQLSGVTVEDHGHIPMPFADRGLIDQQHPTGLFTTMISDQSRPATEQSHDQMPPYPVAAGHRRNRHHLSVLDQPTGQPPGNTAFELGMGFHMTLPTMVAHEEPVYMSV